MSLSDKRKELSNYGLEDTESLGGAAKFYREEDVKAFIKELKEKCYSKIWHDQLHNLIDELAGEKLI